MAKTLREFLISVTTQMDVTGAQATSRAIDGVTARIEAQSRVTVQATQAIKGYFAILAAQAAPSALIGMVDQWTNISVSTGRIMRELAFDTASAEWLAHADRLGTPRGTWKSRKKTPNRERLGVE